MSEVDPDPRRPAGRAGEPPRSLREALAQDEPDLAERLRGPHLLTFDHQPSDEDVAAVLVGWMVPGRAC